MTYQLRLSNKHMSVFILSWSRGVSTSFVRILRPYTILQYACKIKFITRKHKHHHQQANGSQLKGMIC